MNSCCRTAALRIFVRNITQIHFPPPTSAYRVPRYHSTFTRLATLQRTTALSSTRDRLLHTSCPEGKEDGVWPPPEGLPVYQEPSPPKLVLEAANDVGVEPTVAQVSAESSTQSDSAIAKEPRGAPPGPLSKWAKKKLKKAQEAAAREPDGQETSVPDNIESDTTVGIEKGNDEVPLNDPPVEITTGDAPKAQSIEPKDKSEALRTRILKKESKEAKIKRLKKERQEKRRKKLEMIESGEQGGVTMGKASMKRALQEKKQLEQQEQAKAKAKEEAKEMAREVALAEKLKKKAEGKAARKERRRQEFEAQEEAKMKAEKDGELEPWRIQKKVLKEKFPEGWMPRKKLSPDALAGIRALHAQFPEQYSTARLAQKFEVSPEAVRRILKSNWTPDVEEEEERQGRWFNRGKRVWARWAELGKKPPAKWRAEGVVRDPKWNRGRKRNKLGDFLG
ncbi:hypothetical protein QBC40DRAFT_291212 [Triangularia verruculosa]|uniref:Required for respiratory growth protein 9, mitochondrial n=1 Tax=Triangularia verruculosa TaxID=2587418 RepID=A0AAN6X5U0_9PEZI|nr:hypothetical protein QBC40DRAFT_291212 [Triangularia verruculosa]